MLALTSEEIVLAYNGWYDYSCEKCFSSLHLAQALYVKGLKQVQKERSLHAHACSAYSQQCIAEPSPLVLH